MKNNVCFRAVALLLLVTLWVEIFYPPLLFALTSGAAQMEFAGVGPGGSSQMVDPFTGEFSYNLPLLTVPGPHGSSYPVTLNYKSNMSPEDDASWVGYGWSLSPGAITRSRNGFADDLDGSRVTYYNKSEPNITITAGASEGKENADVEIGGLIKQKYLRYNNYYGWSIEQGFFASVMGIGTLGLNSGDDGPSFSASLNPLQGLDKLASTAGFSLPLNYLPPIPKMSKDWDVNPSNLHPTKSVHIQGKMQRFAMGQHLTTTLLKGEYKTSSGSYLQVNTVPEEVKTCYGYMYTGNARVTDIMDYGIEKEKAFHLKRNKFLSIPFSSPDDFIATGSGVGGKFRLYHNKVGTFRPALERSYLPIENTYAEEISPKDGYPTGATGGSGELNQGENTLTIGQWYTPEVQHFAFPRNDGLKDEPYYFRFDGDRGGSSVYHRDTDKPTQARGNGVYDRTLVPPMMNDGDRQGRSSYIGFRTVEDMVRKGGGNINYLAYDKDYSTGSARTLVDRSDNKSGFQKSIGEFALVGSNGSRYTYGLPVYAREETDLAFGVDPIIPKENNFLVRARSDNKKLGEARPDPYASTYLLTEVTTPNYVDINNNGPDNDDLGGYTKFRYHRAYGSDKKRDKGSESTPWYKWRIPYKGLRYEQNNISESRDDIAKVHSGEKEVYYMRSIETKTHIAYFVTNLTDLTINGIEIRGSQTMRIDGCEANPDEDDAVSGDDFPPENFENKLEYLEEIRLYAKDENGNPEKLLKTTYFVYDYSLMAQRTTGDNDLNSLEKVGTGKRVGKLTLRYVWFESENVVNPLISPYEFVYQYPTSSLDSKYEDVYPDAIKPPTYTTPDASENPEYSVFNIDGWGSYQKDGGSRYGNSLTWVNQDPSEEFDPAAWHLKIIRFPSGGELHIQYEQHDYAYVQNRPAMVMVPLLSESTDDNLLVVNTETGLAGEIKLFETVTSRNKFYLDLNAVFGTLTTGQRAVLVKQIKRYFIDAGKQREKMHFRFRYTLPGTPTPLSMEDNQENIAGYASVYECNEESGKVFVRLGTGALTGIPAGDQPRYAAYRFHRTHERNVIPPFGFGEKNAAQIVLTAMQNLHSNEILLNRLLLPELPTLEKQQSYLRIPMPGIAKKGGGVRVKRLLMYSADGSLESGDKVLSGSEYIYETFVNESGSENRISSGIAANEPLQSREENSLIRLVDENDPYVVNHVIAGDDVVQYEGMLGESLLPAPSVGYSRIIIRSISVDNNTDDIIVNPGFSVYDFLTAKDQPTVECIPSEVTHEAKPYNVLMELLQNSEEEIRLTQGYTFMKNNMHGVIRAVHWYGGEYTTDQEKKEDAFADAYSVSAQEYEYFKAAEEVPVMYAPDRPLRMRPIGKQTEVLIEARSMIDITENMPVQASLANIPTEPYLLVSAMFYMFNKHDELYQHVTTKIIDNPVILKKVRSTSEGVVSEVENVVFDAITGSPVVTYTTDGYNKLNLEQSESTSHNGGYYSYNIPAHMIGTYKNMGQYASSAGFIFHNVGNTFEWSMPDVEMTVSASPSDVSRGGTSVGTCSFAIPAGSSLSSAELLQVRNRLRKLLHTLTPGDMIELKNIYYSRDNQYTGSKGVYYLGEVTEDISDPTNPSLSFELFDPHFGSVPGMRSGNGVAVEDANLLEVIQSGKDNSTFASAGVVVTYGKDVTTAILCAKDIREREKYANSLNYYLNAAVRSTYEGTEQILSETSPLYDQTLTWKHIDMTTLAERDVVNEADIPFYPSYDPLTAYTCGGIPPYPPYLFCKIGESQVRERFHWRLTKTGVIGSEVISMGWWDYKNNEWTGISTPGAAGGILQQDLAYTGKEKFGVNDDGELVWYQFPDEAPNTPRNLSCMFRGAVNRDDDPPREVPVPITRVDAIPSYILDQVLRATAQTFSDNWPHDFDPDNTEYNLYETGKRGRWRPDASFVYRDGSVVPGSYDEDVISTETGSRVDERVYKNAGTFALPSLFNYANPLASVAAGWMQPVSIQKYTRHGNVEQVKDILDIHASSRLAHGGNVQSISASPAEVSEISFDSFEDFTPGAEDIASSIAHTGKYSHVLTTGYTYTSPAVNYGTGNIVIRFWVRGVSPTSPVNVSPVSAPLSPSVLIDFISSTLSISSFSTSKIARTGEWTLYEVVVPSTSIMGSGSFQLHLAASSGHSFYIDDVVIKPWLAESVCYVYERHTLRPLAVLDGEHFALVYQYDGEGKLTRFIKETIKGYKTMGDGFIHIPQDKVRAVLLDQGEHILSSMITSSDGRTAPTSSMRQMIRSQRLEEALSPQENPLQIPMQGVEGNFDLLNLHITPDKSSLKWIGQDSATKLPELPSMKKPALQAPSGLMQAPSADSLTTVRQFIPPVDATRPDSVQKRATDSLKKRSNSSTGKIKK